MQTHEALEEYVILLDQDGREIGTAPKNSVHGADTSFHLAFSCYVFNARGEVLITRRALGKKAWPGVWTNSFCGHPLPAEPLPTAVLVEQDDVFLERFCGLHGRTPSHVGEDTRKSN